MSDKYLKFNSLSSAKKERVINAALKEFSKNGFKKASTNVITENANIAKGSLFTYFKSKKELFIFLVDYMMDISNQIIHKIDLKQTELFQRLKETGIIKYNVMKRFPQGFDFLKSLEHENSDDVKPELEERKNEILNHGLNKMYENIDWSKFRDDINLEKSMNIIQWFMLSLSEQQISRLESFKEIDNEILSEWDDYFDILKRCFYK
jgi:AcrR family transcriptional regulator